jgi:hypothetical protein
MRAVSLFPDDRGLTHLWTFPSASAAPSLRLAGGDGLIVRMADDRRLAADRIAGCGELGRRAEAPHGGVNGD